MIPRDFITEWRANAPWVQDFQVEQDLVISRALVDIFSHPLLKTELAFRGGTALYKLHLSAARYSEDIDLVQVNTGPAGPIMDALHDTLDPWLGEPRTKRAKGGVTITYRFMSEGTPPVPLKLKVEINSREHFSLYGIRQVPFSVSSRWFKGACQINTYDLNELLGTKLRALYQRKKGRDLFDLSTALGNPEVDPQRVIGAFLEYMTQEGHQVTRADFEENFANKLKDTVFTSDISPLLASTHAWDPQAAAEFVSARLIQFLPGKPWKGEP